MPPGLSRTNVFVFGFFFFNKHIQNQFYEGQQQGQQTDENEQKYNLKII
jgi:hypothetical protein